MSVFDKMKEAGRKLQEDTMQKIGMGLIKKMMQPGSLQNLEKMICNAIPEKVNQCYLIIPLKDKGMIMAIPGTFTAEGKVYTVTGEDIIRITDLIDLSKINLSQIPMEAEDAAIMQMLTDKEKKIATPATPPQLAIETPVVPITQETKPEEPKS